MMSVCGVPRCDYMALTSSSVAPNSSPNTRGPARSVSSTTSLSVLVKGLRTMSVCNEGMDEVDEIRMSER